jgi:hypothetical protein
MLETREMKFCKRCGRLINSPYYTICSTCLMLSHQEKLAGQPKTWRRTVLDFVGVVYEQATVGIRRLRDLGQSWKR